MSGGGWAVRAGRGGVGRWRRARDGRRGVGGRRLSEGVTRLNFSVMPHDPGCLQRGSSSKLTPAETLAGQLRKWRPKPAAEFGHSQEDSSCHGLSGRGGERACFLVFNRLNATSYRGGGSGQGTGRVRVRARRGAARAGADAGGHFARRAGTSRCRWSESRRHREVSMPYKLLSDNGWHHWFNSPESSASASASKTLSSITASESAIINRMVRCKPLAL